jgi:hypothetical protein
MDGIGGLIIGHLFKIPPDLLPRGYGSDTVGGKLIQTITSISHKIENGDWTTTIDALNITTKESSGITTTFNDLLTEGKDKFKIKTPGVCDEPYTNVNLNKGWEGKQVTYEKTIINPAEEGPKLTQKYGKVLAQAVLTTIQIEQSYKGFNWNLGGFDITSGGWLFDARYHNGYVIAKEGGTGLCKAFISFKDFDSFVAQKIAVFKQKGFDKAVDANIYGKLWYEKWNGYGARAVKPANVSLADFDAQKVSFAANIWRGNAKYV